MHFTYPKKETLNSFELFERYVIFNMVQISFELAKQIFVIFNLLFAI